MRIVARIMAVVLLFVPVLAAAATKKPRAVEPPFPRAEAILKWVNGYRADPQPEKLPAAVRAMGELGSGDQSRHGTQTDC
jgi:hypothetical protein